MIDRVMIMKKIREISGNIFFSAAVLCLGWYCITETDEVSAAVSSGAERCIDIIIPSLYAMLAVSAAFVRSGLAGCMPSFIRKSAGRILGMKGNSFPIFIFSQIAGYPAGAGMLMTEYRSGRLSKRSAELLMGVCFGAGPAFIFGCISSQLYGSPGAGRMILISAVSANVISAFGISFLLRREQELCSERLPLSFSGGMLTGSAAAGGRASAGVCFMVMMFSVLSAMLRDIGAAGAAAAAISHMTGYDEEMSRLLFDAFLDVTAVSRLTPGNYAVLPAVSALVSFGGICVIMQIASIADGELSILPMIVIRAAAACLSSGICRLIMPFFLEGEAVAASAGFHVYRASSPVPSVMLMLMTIMLLSGSEGRNMKKFSE